MSIQSDVFHSSGDSNLRLKWVGTFYRAYVRLGLEKTMYGKLGESTKQISICVGVLQKPNFCFHPVTIFFFAYQLQYAEKIAAIMKPLSCSVLPLNGVFFVFSLSLLLCPT